MLDLLLKSTAEDIMGNYAIYRYMLKVMESADGKAPAGSCCGKNKEKHINLYFANLKKYTSYMTKIQARQIKPLWKGVIMFAGTNRYYSAETMTDELAKQLIKNIKNPEKFFDLSNYQPDEEAATEEPKELTTAEKRKIALAKARAAKKAKQK